MVQRSQLKDDLGKVNRRDVIMFKYWTYKQNYLYLQLIFFVILFNFWTLMKQDQEQFEILRKIYKSSNSSQRNLSNQLGFSLGKLNYCLTRLKKHGLIRIKRFKDSKNKR